MGTATLVRTLVDEGDGERSLLQNLYRLEPAYGGYDYAIISEAWSDGEVEAAGFYETDPEREGGITIADVFERCMAEEPLYDCDIACYLESIGYGLTS